MVFELKCLLFSTRFKEKMKKRKAKRTKSVIDIDLQISKAISNSEEMKKESFLNLIAKIILDANLKEFYSKDEPPE